MYYNNSLDMHVFTMNVLTLTYAFSLLKVFHFDSIIGIHLPTVKVVLNRVLDPLQLLATKLKLYSLL